MDRYNSCVWWILAWLVCSGSCQNDSTVLPAEARNNAVFNLLRLDSALCSNEKLRSICMSRWQCLMQRGTYQGMCALGFGVCCAAIRNQCVDSTTVNNTYYQVSMAKGTGSNGEHETVVCRLSVKGAKKQISQYRIDFITLEISPPDPSSICNVDVFKVIAAESSVPIICGNCSGNHIYVQDPLSSDGVVLMFILVGRGVRQWNLLVSQMGPETAAPPGCLQYHVGYLGQIRSFNWMPENGLHLANQMYSICIRSEVGFCYLCLWQCHRNGFSLSGPKNQAKNNQNPKDCDHDFLEIPAGSSLEDIKVHKRTSEADRFCGDALQPEGGAANPMPVCTSHKPFMLYFMTDHQEVRKDANSGFCLNFEHFRC